MSSPQQNTEQSQERAPKRPQVRIFDLLLWTTCTALIMAFGVCFQLPIVLTLMARAGLIGSDTLIRKRRYAVVGVFAAAALMTPPDPISQIGLAVPTYLLYEGSIFMVKFVEKKRREREEARA